MRDLVPREVLAFLASGGKLEYDEPASTVGHIRLISPKKLRVSEIEVTSEESEFCDIDPYAFLDGAYRFDVVSLVAESDHYEPEGILGWIPVYNSFGSWDSEHQSLLLFPNATWSDIVQNPTPYLDAQWEHNALARHVRMPWLDAPYALTEYDLVLEPYSGTCDIHRTPLVTASRRSYPTPIADLRDAFRLRDVEDYLEHLIATFPCAGVPANESSDLYCPSCFDAEKAWLIRASIQEPQAARVSADGIVRCPHCRVTFAVTNPESVVHGYHRRCGTRLSIVED